MDEYQGQENGADRSIEELHAELSDLQQELDDKVESARQAQGERDVIRQYIDIAGVLFVVIGADETVRLVNRKTCEVLGYAEEEMIGRNWFDSFLPERIRPQVHAVFAQLMAGEVAPVEFAEGIVVTKAGEERAVAWHNSVLRDDEGKPVGSLSSGEDITERRKLQQERERQMEVIRRQSEDILEISTPVIQIWEGVLVAPLIGTFDSERTQRFVENLLESIVETKSPMVLLDITGVPSVDTQTAQHLIDTISAVRLLGAQVVLTGVRPAIAQTLVHLGIDLADVTTKTSLSAGLRVAFETIGVEVAES